MKKIVAILLIAALGLSACGGTYEITGQSSSTYTAETVSSYEAAAPEEKLEIIKGKSLDKIGYRCEAPLDIEIEEDILLGRWSDTGYDFAYMGTDKILGEDTYTIISVLFYGPHSLGSEMLYFMYLQAFSTTDVNDKNSVKIGQEVYTFDDLQPYLVFKTDDICVYDVYKLTGDDDLQTKIAEQIGFQNEMVTNAVNATAEEREKYNIFMTEEDYVTYEDYNYLHKIAEYYKTHIGEMIVKKSEPTDSDSPPVLVDELTIAVLTPDGKPVPNIGVYGNPTQSAFLSSSTISHAVTDNEGIAILQRVHTSEKPNEVITVGLADRNQSDAIQQTIAVTMPDSGLAYEPQAVVWNKTLPTDYLKEQTDTITLTIVNTAGETLPNMWVKLGLATTPSSDGINPDMGHQQHLPYADRYLITGADGSCTFSNVENVIYDVGLWGGSPPFNLVPSDNPRLQEEMIYPDKSIWGTTIDYTEGGKQAFTLEFVPHAT